jgi:hypothetical protein
VGFGAIIAADLAGPDVVLEGTANSEEAAGFNLTE